ncbi:MAG TPA: AraC family transcriptional regulator [Mucilaginibacter sp.]|jgi:AraC-like DNA-binding protein
MQEIVLAVMFISFLLTTLAGSLLFWVNKESKISTRNLAFIMFLLAIMSLNYVLRYSGFYVEFPGFHKSLLPFNFLVTPFLWLYVRSVLQRDTKFRKNDWFVFIPAMLAAITLIPYCLMELTEKQRYLINYYRHPAVFVYRDEGRFPIYAYAFVECAWNVLFIFFSYRLIRRFLKTSSVNSLADNSKLIAWLKILNCLMVVIAISSSINTFLAPRDEMNLLIVKVILGASIIGICIQLFIRPQILYGIVYPFSGNDNYKTGLPKSYANIETHQPGILHNDHVCAESTKLFLIQFDNYGCKKKIESLFIEKKPFVRVDYSLEQLALDTRIPRHTLSAFINYEYGINFREFLNRYRVDYFKENLDNPRWRNLTLEAMASDCGFGSRSSFIKNFKLITGQTPGEHLKEHKPLRSSELAMASL